MLRIGNREFRSLEEQVNYLGEIVNYLQNEQGVLNQFGLKVVGNVAVENELPTVEDYKISYSDWSYGDCYIIGVVEPYIMKVLTRADDTHPDDYWFTIGQFPLAGPKGDKGDTGETGATGPRGPQGVPGIQGVQGPQGVRGATGATGPQGIQGEKGEKGDKGDPGLTYKVVGTLSSTDQLPTPTELIRANGYLIPDSTGTNHLWVITGSTSLVWTDTGAFTGTQGPQGIQGEQGPQGEAGKDGAQGPQGEQGPQGVQGIQGPVGPQGPKGDTGDTAQAVELTSPASATSGTLSDEKLAALQASEQNYIKFNNEIYRLDDAQHDDGFLIYSHTGQDNTKSIFIKEISITISTKAWTLTKFKPQSKLTFDSTPTANSTNPVTSNGVYQVTRPHIETLVSNGSWNTSSQTHTTGTIDSTLGDPKFIVFSGRASGSQGTEEEMRVYPTSLVPGIYSQIVMDCRDAWAAFKDITLTKSSNKYTVTFTIRGQSGWSNNTLSIYLIW